MRWTRWRRAIALVALIVGLGVAANSAPASAATADTSAHFAPLDDNWW